MGGKLDLSGLTDSEAEHVLQVVQRDMRLRKKEEQRLSELRQELDEEGSRCLLLSRQSCFNRRCCIRCCSPFTFLLNPKRRCRDCRYNVCKACRVYNKRDDAWLCCACQKSRLLKTQSLEWFYTNVKKRFKRFGSAKVLKTLYRKHLAEHSALSELTEGSAYEESICNEGSVSESDSTFYRQSEEHSMAETLTVAVRVAEEAIDEAISKAEFDPASQKKQNEAHYLREHRAELIEELAKTIVQKIISRRKTLAEMRAEYNQEWPLEQNVGPHRPQASDQASSSLQHQAGLWRSHSAFSLSANDPPGLMQDSPQALIKEGAGSAMSAWRSVDRLDNAGVSSVLKSPDGNWIALQSAQLSRPSLLTKRKSLVYSALERESGVVSAYEGMGSDNEAKPELDGSWGAVLQEIHRKMTDSNLNLQDARERISSDSEGNRKSNKPLLALFKRKLPAEIRRTPSSRRTSIIDVNFNVERAGEEQHGSAGAEAGKVRRSRRKRRSKKEQVSSSVDLNRKDNQSEQTSDAMTPDTLTSAATTPEPLEPKRDITDRVANHMEEQPAGHGSDCSTGGQDLGKERDADEDDRRQRMERREAGEEGNESVWKMEIDVDEDRPKDEERDLDLDDEEMKERLYRLVAQSRLTYFSSTDEELNKLAEGEEKWEEDNDEDMEGDEEQKEETTERLTLRLCQLEKEVRASQFSSTEDELDRAADAELAVKVCRLAGRVDASQFSSTEDELDAAEGGGEEEKQVINEQTLWTLQTEKTVQAAQLRDLASLVSASQFSSTEDELDRVGEKEQEEDGGGTEERWGGEVERRESFGDLDVKMFDLKEETKSGNKEGRACEIQAEEEQNHLFIYNSPESDQTGLDERPGEEKQEDTEDAAGGRGAEEGEAMHLTMEAEKETSKETVEDEKQPEAKWPSRDGGDGRRDAKFKESQAKRETTADSYEDDAEFDRIISSMLMMTLDDMQVEPLKEEPAETEKRRKQEDGEGDKAQEGGESGSEKAGSGEDSRPASAMDERLGGSVTEQTGDDSSNEERSDAPRSRDEEERSDAPRRREEEKSDAPGRRDEEEAADAPGRQEEEKSDAPSRRDEEEAADAPRRREEEERSDAPRRREEEERSDAPRRREEEERSDAPRRREEERSDAPRRREEERSDAPRSRDEEEAADAPRRREEEEERSDAPRRREEEAADAPGSRDEEEAADAPGSRDEEEAADVQETHQTCEEKEDGGEQATGDEEGLLSPQGIHNGSYSELHRAVDFISTLLEQRYSAASLRSITTEVLKVLNATEDLLQGVEGDGPPPSSSSLPPHSDPKELDERFSTLEESVYVAAGSVYGLEAELSDLEQCARGICSSTSNTELCYLEEQVASAAAKVQQSELQISDISARIAALKNAGLNVDTQSRFKTRTIPVMPVTLDSSRQLRRRLPAPPGKDDKSV